jgi:hypothetical protein
VILNTYSSMPTFWKRKNMLRPLMTKKQLMELPPAERLALANELLESLTLDFKPLQAHEKPRPSNTKAVEIN